MSNSDLSSWGWMPGWVGTIPLRIGAALTLGYLHVWPESLAAWHHLWNQAPWELPLILQKASFPYPHIVAYAGTVIACSVVLSWFFGFLTRFFSFIFLPVAIGIIFAGNSLNEATSVREIGALYLFIALSLLVTGSGWFSVDGIFQFGTRRPKKKTSFS